MYIRKNGNIFIKGLFFLFLSLSPITYRIRGNKRRLDTTLKHSNPIKRCEEWVLLCKWVSEVVRNRSEQREGWRERKRKREKEREREKRKRKTERERERNREKERERERERKRAFFLSWKMRLDIWDSNNCLKEDERSIPWYHTHHHACFQSGA